MGNVLRKIVVPETCIKNEWRKLLIEELYSVVSVPSFIAAINSSRMRHTRSIVHMKKVRNAFRVLVGNFKGTDHLVDIGVRGSIILKRTL